MNPKELLNEISSGKFRPLYYFFGEEDYRIVEAEKFLAKSFLPARQHLTNYDRIDSRRVKTADLLARLAAFPMLGERQLIAVSEIQRFKPKELAQILKLLQPPDPNRIVVFTSPSARMPKKSSALVKTMNKAGLVVEFKRYTLEEARRLIITRLTKHGLEIEPQALDALVTLLNGNRGAMDHEISKLIDYSSGQGKVTLDDIDRVACGYQTSIVFDLANEVVAGNQKRVLAMIRQFLAGGSSATGLLYFLGQHFVSLYHVKAGKSLDSRRRWLANQFREQATQYSMSELERGIVAIAQADSDLRHQTITPEVVLDKLVIGLMQTEQAGV